MDVLQDCNSFQNFIASHPKKFLWHAVMIECILIGFLFDCFCSSELKAEPLDLEQNFVSFSSDEASKHTLTILCGRGVKK